MIYALLDKEVLLQKGFSLKQFFQQIQLLDVLLVQYRNKVGSLDEKRDDLLEIKKYYQGKVIVNDTLELIEYADGLHLGQDDLRAYNDDLTTAIRIVREKISYKLLGLSTHNQTEILEANTLNIDYIGLGAYRSTQTKVDAKVLGEEAITLAKLSKHPVGLIGGVKLSDTFTEDIAYRVIGSDLYEN